jgi:hypothetical protein
MLESRKKRVRDLYYGEGKTTREIAEIERMSIRDISNIIKEEEAKKQGHEDDFQKQLEEKISADAYNLFNAGKTPVEVAIELGCGEPRVSKFFKEYLRLKGLYEVASLCEKLGDDVLKYLELYNLSNASGMNSKDIVKAVDIALNKLPSVDQDYFQTRNKLDQLVNLEQFYLGHVAHLEGKKSTLLKDNLDLQRQAQNWAEYLDRIKLEVEGLQKEHLRIQNTMDKHHQVVIGRFAGAVSIVLKTFELNITRAVEIREMHEGDIV